MKVSDNTNFCARAEDLVTYIYGEASPFEAKSFEQHLELCASCSKELAGFGDVRQAMGEWRQEALGTKATAPAPLRVAPEAFAPPLAHARRRSALAAFREFFTLAPVWMRAATAMTAIVFCALAAFTVAYFVRPPQTVVVEKQVPGGYSEQQLKAQIDEAIRRHDESLSKDEIVSSPENIKVASSDSRKIDAGSQRKSSSGSQMQDNKRRQLLASRTRMRPSVELVSTDYLPFTASNAEDELPALTDLVDDAN